METTSVPIGFSLQLFLSFQFSKASIACLSCCGVSLSIINEGNKKFEKRGCNSKCNSESLAFVEKSDAVSSRKGKPFYLIPVNGAQIVAVELIQNLRTWKACLHDGYLRYDTNSCRPDFLKLRSLFCDFKDFTE